MTIPPLTIGSRTIGPGTRCYVIAEIGVNHEGSLDRALDLIDAAAATGADAIKLQYFETDRLLSNAARLATYQHEAGERDPIDMLRRLELSIEQLGECVRRAHARGVHAIVTVFSTELVDKAAALPWDAFKSASPDLMHRPLLERLATDGRPLIVSTGAATLDEVTEAVDWLEPARNRLALLQCVSSYPTAQKDAQLAGISALARATGLPVGYSDHTAEPTTSALAVHAGACILEKHLTHDCNAPGPDHAASLDPSAFARYVELVRRTPCVDALAVLLPSDGPPSQFKRVQPSERDVRTLSRQSVVLTRDARAGDTITADMLTIKRPGVGVPPASLNDLVGRTLRADAIADEPLRAEAVDWDERRDVA